MSRLSVLVSVLALASALVAATALAAAQNASPAASPAAVPSELADWAAAWAVGDVEGVLAAFTDDADFEEVPIGVVTHGQDELRAHLEGLKAAFPDISIVVTDGFVAGDRAAAEWTFTGTYSGQFPGLPPGAGQTGTVRGASILELEGGKVRADREYWDAHAFLVQSGELPAPATPAS
jgi:steroid delta-isomerase-like uncharacterized protein